MEMKLQKLMLMLIILVLLASCKVKLQEPMRIGTIVWPGYEPIYLAHGLKYFDPGSVQPVGFPSSTETMAAFRNRTIEAAALTLDETLTLAQFDPDFLIVLVVDISNGADVILGNPGIKSMKDLRGKRIGVESTAVGIYTLTRALQKSGLKYEEINIVNLNVNEHEAAFKQGTIDAVVTFEPVRTRLLAAGASLLFDSSQIPNEIFDVIVVRKGYLHSHTDIVKKFIRGWFWALDYMKEHPSEAAETMKGRLKISADEVITSYKGLVLPDRDKNRRLLRGNQPLLLESSYRLEKLMTEQKLLYKKINVPSLLEQRVIGKLYE